MEALRVTKEDVPRQRALVRLADTVSPFGPGGRLKLGEPDSPLAQAVQGGAQVGNTVAEPPKHDVKERKEGSVTDPERAQVREVLFEYAKELFEKGSSEEIIEAYLIRIKASAPQEIMSVIRTLSEKPQNGALTRDRVFELAELGLKKLIGKCAEEDIPRLAELVKSLRACRNFELQQREKLVELGVKILREMQFTDPQLVALYGEMGETHKAVDIAVKQNPPRLWAIEYLKGRVADTNETSTIRNIAQKALIEMAKSVLGTETL